MVNAYTVRDVWLMLINGMWLIGYLTVCCMGTGYQLVRKSYSTVGSLREYIGHECANAYLCIL